MKLFVLAACVAAASAAGHMHTPAVSMANPDAWVYDHRASDEFTISVSSRAEEAVNTMKWLPGFYDMQQCSPEAYSNEACEPQWYGTQPVVIHPEMARVVNAGMLNLKYRGTVNRDTELLGMANMSVDAPAECDCGYHSKRTGLIKSYTEFNGGHFEVKIDVSKSQNQVASVWFQSKHLELSAINIENGKLWSAWYIFNETHVIKTTKKSIDHIPTGPHVYSFTWMPKTGNVMVYIDGEMAYTLEGAFSAETEMYMMEQSNVVIDIQAPKDAVAEDLANGIVAVDYFRTWQIDCPSRMMESDGTKNFKFSSNGNKDLLGLQGLVKAKQECEKAPYADYCTTMGIQRLCLNVGPATADLTSFDSLGACTGINNEKMCGGSLDRKGQDGTGDFNGYRGSHGHCVWDFTINTKTPFIDAMTSRDVYGACVPKIEKRLAADRIYDIAKCGGVQDETEGKGMFCFGKCVTKTFFNRDTIGGGKLFCHTVRDENGMDECVKIGMMNYTTFVDGRGRTRVQVSKEDCMAAGKHCFLKTFQASKAPFIVMDNGAQIGGEFCFSRDHRQEKKSQGAILPKEIGVEHQCLQAGRKWGCLKSGEACRKTDKNFNPANCPP